ncbi:PREDICTED: kinesin-like protein KIF23 [Nicrophorus vespilloides]|uniref:Kinesin-like protein n=1 Tax=Nicrophorus vespilloides TaxID=110193 RepID=A0ABM1MPL8_NICVS|nr:PREDICTED: kinesin-like protein KIF23 [Nicrophorus vespilloides]
MNFGGKFTPKTPRREKTNLSSSSDSEKVKDPVSVFCRLRNLRDENEASCIKLMSPTVLSLICPSESRVLRKDTHYAFKHIFTSYASQKEVFDHIAYPLLEDLLRGKNGLLFTYGVTGSGKTYTLTGDPYNPGIMPRCIDTLFNSIAEHQAQKYIIKSDKMNGFEVQSEADARDDCLHENRSTKSLRKKGSGDKVLYTNDGTSILGINERNLYSVFISYIEIYNNTVYDLLDESGGKVLQSKILREDSQKNMYVNGVVEQEVKCAAEAFELFNAGQKRKRMGHTLLNAESSRSHSIFNIRVVQLEQYVLNSNGERVIPAQNLLKVGQLSLVDLAGSERSNRTQNTGMRLKEASSINNSLMSLRNCMEILRENQINNGSRLVPYRESRLTHIFKNYFEGEGRVEMIVCASPSVLDYEENLQVMKFADIASDVKVVRPESRFTPYKTKASKSKPTVETPITKIKATAPLVFGPKIPLLKLNFENIDDSIGGIRNLVKIIQTRKQKSLLLNREINAKDRAFRKRLAEMNSEYTLKISELKSAQQQYKKEKKKSQNLEVKVLELEKMNDSLDSKNVQLVDSIRNLRCNLDEKDLKLNQNLMEREKQKQKMALKQEKMNQELDDKLRRQRDHLNAAMRAKEDKLKRVRDLLDEEHAVVVAATPTKSVVSEVSNNKPPVPHRSRHVAVANRRRSKSVGEVWLEHNSVKPVPLGTVMQPSMNKRKSVSKLSKASDITHPKQSKYCLIAQEADTDGEVETKVYKADILPTCGGGAQVIFNDVERLRQESPVGTPQKYT